MQRIHNPIAATFLFVLATGLSAFGDTDHPSASGLPITGRVFSDIYFPVGDYDSSDIIKKSYRQASTSVWLQGDPRLGENGSARFILTGDALDANHSVIAPSGASNSQFQIGLREGYVSYFKSGWEIRLGRQILPWGKSDAINPTDFLTAKDFTFFNPDEEVRRLGATSLWTSWTPSEGNSPLTFTAVLTPVFPQSRLLIPPSAVPAGTQVSASPISPPQTLAHTETAIKAAYNGSNWDASILAFRGFNHMPEFTITDLAINPLTGVPTRVSLAQTFHQIHAAGGDASLTTGKWILRAESAYVWTENNEGTNPLIQPSHWDSVMGAERPLGDDFRVQAQFIYRYFPAFLPPSQAGGDSPALSVIHSQVASANALLLGYQDKSRPAATFRIAYKNESNGFDAELFLLGNFVGGDYLARPKVSYHWTDALQSTLGIDYYAGPNDRPLGALKTYNSIFTEGKYTF